MKLTVALLALTAALLPAIAAPAPEAVAAEVAKRDNTIYVCSGTYAPYRHFVFPPIDSDWGLYVIATGTGNV